VDLTIPDSTLILPCFCALTSALISESSILMNPTLEPVAKITLRVFPVISFFVCQFFPAGLQLYWAGSSLLAGISMTLFRMDPVRRLFNIPTVSEEAASKPVEVPVKPAENMWAPPSNPEKQPEKDRVNDEETLFKEILEKVQKVEALPSDETNKK